MNRFSFFIICGLALLLFSSCKDQGKKVISEHLDALYGKEVKFVHQDRYIIDGRDTVIHMTDTPDFKIVIFADSSGCQPCNLRLGEFNLKIRELKLIDKNARFIVIVQNSDYREFEHNVKHDMPGYPFIYDTEGLFLKINKLPLDSRFHAFLLDKNDKIVLVGNPVGNDKLWDLYKRHIRESSTKN